jgi:hypothetical protein
MLRGRTMPLSTFIAYYYHYSVHQSYTIMQEENTNIPPRVSDKKIRIAANKYISDHDSPRHAFLRGAKWMREELADMIQIILLTDKNPNHHL